MPSKKNEATTPQPEINPKLAEMLAEGTLEENNTLSQTDPELSSDADGGSAEGELSQTDLEIPSETSIAHIDVPSQGEISQTDLDNLKSSPTRTEDAVEFADSSTSHQTDLETLSDDLPSAGLTHDSGAKSDILQTEPKTAKRTKRKSTGQAKTAPIDSNSSESAQDATRTDEEAAGDVKKPSRSGRKVAVVSIDERRTVETEADKQRNDLLDLVESQKSGRLLTGKIQGIETAENNSRNAFAVIYYGSFKVIIPVTEGVDPPESFHGHDPDLVYKYMMTKRLGAEVDYIVKGIDTTNKIAIASRVDAMRSKRKEYYFGTDRDGNNLIHSGICAEARVVSVIRTGLFADIFGLEVYIPLKELSYQRWMDASQHFQPGQRVLVKILEVNRMNRDEVSVSASIKQAEKNPYEKALHLYVVGNRYVGTVSMVDTNGVFVALDGGIDCLCSYPKRGRPPRGARVTVRIMGKNFKSNRIWGVITHIAAAR